MDRAKNSGRKLSVANVRVVKGMLLRGDRQHDIAAWFGVNAGRIGEINNRTKFRDVLPQTQDLPPPGPYLSGLSKEILAHELAIVYGMLSVLVENETLPLDVRGSLEEIHFRINAIALTCQK